MINKNMCTFKKRNIFSEPSIRPYNLFCRNNHIFASGVNLGLQIQCHIYSDIGQGVIHTTRPSEISDKIFAQRQSHF